MKKEKYLGKQEEKKASQTFLVQLKKYGDVFEEIPRGLHLFG